jgi:hypothetical protein
MAKPPKKLGGPQTDPAVTPDVVEKYLKVLRDYQNAVFGVIVVILVVGVLGVWQHERTEQQESLAWGELVKTKNLDVDKMKAVLDKYEGTDAHPFLVLAYCSKLYDRGEKADLEQAKTLLERVRDEVSGNKVVGGVIDEQLKGIRAELGDAKQWADTAPIGSAK